jgi:hypothetical protein
MRQTEETDEQTGFPSEDRDVASQNEADRRTGAALPPQGHSSAVKFTALNEWRVRHVSFRWNRIRPTLQTRDP